MNRKLNWLILTDSYDEKKGGPLIIHNIAKLLYDKGDMVMVSSESKFKEINKFDPGNISNLNPEEWIVLTTECDNRLNHFPNIARILLYFPGFFKGTGQPYTGGYSKKELIFQYGNSFTFNSEYENVPDLKLITFDFDFWKNNEEERSDVDLILIKKGTVEIQDKEKVRILDDEDFNNDTLLEAFNKHKKFITYDNDTFHSVQAAICGAISIVIPDGTKTEKEWRSGNLNRKFGIAFGDTPEQIDFAIKTRPKMLSLVQKQLDETDKKIIDFRRLVSEKFIDKNKICFILETKWEYLNIVSQIDEIKQDSNISQIILIDRNKKDRPNWIKLDGIEVIESNLNRIPSIEMAIEKSYCDIIMLSSDSLKFNSKEITDVVFNNRLNFNLISMERRSYVSGYFSSGFMQKNSLSDFENNYNESNIDKLCFFKKSNYIKTPGLQTTGLNQWLLRTQKSNHYMVTKNKIDKVSDVYDIETLQNKDLEILNSIK